MDPVLLTLGEGLKITVTRFYNGISSRQLFGLSPRRTPTFGTVFPPLTDFLDTDNLHLERHSFFESSRLPDPVEAV